MEWLMIGLIVFGVCLIISICIGPVIKIMTYDAYEDRANEITKPQIDAIRIYIDHERDKYLNNINKISDS